MEAAMVMDVMERAKHANLTAEERRLAAIRMRDKGFTYEEIGKAFGVSRQRAHQMTKEKEPAFRDNEQVHIRDYSMSRARAPFTIEQAGSVWHIRTTTGYRLGPYSTEKRAEEMRPLLAKAYAVFASRSSTALECAKLIGDLLRAKLTQTEIATVFNKRETWISFISKLNRMPDGLLKYLRQDLVKTTTVLKAVDQFGATATEKAIRTILAKRPGKVTHRELYERMVGR